MNTALIWIARIAAIVGVGILIVAVLARLLGLFWLGGFQIGTLLQGGTAVTVVACLAYLAAWVEHRAPR